jgi:hypothetical protein
MLLCVLLVAIACCTLATLAGAVVLTRSALRLSRRLEQMRHVIAGGRVLADRAQEIRTRAARVRAEGERLGALARRFR